MERYRLSSRWRRRARVEYVKRSKPVLVVNICKASVAAAAMPTHTHTHTEQTHSNDIHVSFYNVRRKQLNNVLNNKGRMVIVVL